MTAERRSPRPRLGGLGIIVALGVAGLAVGGALAFALRGSPGVAPAPTPGAASATFEPSVEPSMETPALGLVSSAPGVTASSSVGPPAAGGPSSPSPSPSSSPSSPSSSVAAPPPSGTRARIDPSLLSVLPSTVGGLAVHEFPEAEAQAVNDPNLGQNVVRFVTAFVGDAKGANWAYVAVVDLRPGAGTDAFYRDWRDSFDSSACERAGGVAGHSTITIAARAVDRANCGSGVRTYHVLVGGTSLLVSASDYGDAQFGQQVLGALTP